MIDTAPELAAERHGERLIELRVAPRLENLTVLRTLVGAAGALANLDLDTVADLRLAVDEVCTQLIRSASPGATLVVVVDPGGEDFVVRASALCETDEVLARGSFSWFVLTSLVDEVTTFSDGQSPAEPFSDGQAPTEPDVRGGVAGIALTTRRVGAAR